MNQNILTHLEKLKEELGKLEPAVTHLQKADDSVKSLQNITDKLLLMVLELHKENENLAKSNSELIDKIEKIDFPSWLEKLDTTIGSIIHGQQNTQTRIENLEKTATAKFEKLSKENKLLKVLLFISIGLTLGLIVFRFIS
ncbi:MAG: hypothetical protein HY958_14775 [Bacteroidia bacterium]|nr:hypothetical protein [Bacteroidia bacterium]